MFPQPGGRPRGARGDATPAARRPKRRFARTPAVEPLEGRQLLAQFYSGPSAVRPVQSTGGMFTLSMSGPGFLETRPAGHGAVTVTLFGTTQASTLNVALTRPRLHLPSASLPIAGVQVRSGVLGGISAGAATLLGPVSPLGGQVNGLAFGALGPNAQIDVNGPLGSLQLGSVDLGPNGHVRVGGDLATGLSVGGTLTLDGGQFTIGHDLAGPLKLGGLDINRGGRFLVAHDLTGGAQITGDLAVTGGGVFGVGHNLNGLTVSQTARLDGGGQIVVGNDLAGTLQFAEGVSLSNNARLAVARDVTGSIDVTGNLTLATGGAIGVGRLLNTLSVHGDLNVDPSGGSITTGGDLNTLTIDGAFVGKGSKSLPPDLTVGLNLGSLNVLGGGSNRGGLQNANIDVTKSLLGLNVPHGIFNTFLTAGILIDGGTTSANGSVGADGPDAVLNSDIRAGVRIDHLTISGNVRSTFATNLRSTGYRTRIVAGEDRQGNYTSGGVIDHFQITGQLIDSVVAASVAPAGGNGTLPTFAYGAPPPAVGNATGDLGNNTYDAPAGVTVGGTVGAPVRYANYTELSYFNETLVGVNYDTAHDPTIDDAILPGRINPSFASAPVPATVSGSTVTTTNNSTTTQTPVTGLDVSTTALPLPTQSTVLGGVVSTVHGDEADFAGLFAADTRGVFVGNLPSS